MKFLTVLLERKHRKELFSRGKPMLDRYIQKQAAQDMKRKLFACFVLEQPETPAKSYKLTANS